MKIYIYQIYFSTSDKSYIGQTDNLERRMRAHLYSDSLVGRALNKYDDWKICVLHTRTSRDEANLIEIEEIRNFNCIRPNGYNITAGGDGSLGAKHTKESNEKNRQAHLGKQTTLGKHWNLSAETKLKMQQAALGNQNHLGHKHSKESKEKMSKAALGRKHSEVTIEKIRQIHLGTKRSERTKLRMRISQSKRRIRELGGN